MITETRVEVGPRRTLTVLRSVAVLHTLAVLAQPLLAGVYLGGEVDALGMHELNAHITSGLGAIQLFCAIAFTWRGRGARWPVWTSLAIVLAEQAQVGLGYGGVLAFHVPLGVTIVSTQLLSVVWLFRSAMGRPR
ncbi:hypothetical protein [Actinokineospora sp. HUAS TT18]|uniref:hypothetical protein n=1 Tax=Actinokineospora sp. HUAS TT18 TaxID=3447451 RepID=UPI003F5257F3